jgi:hypothetical protein
MGVEGCIRIPILIINPITPLSEWLNAVGLIGGYYGVDICNDK